MALLVWTGFYMGEAFVELLFWVVIFVGLFFGVKKLQQRKKDRDNDGSP
ncbi:MAG: hypothetical protein ABJ360_21020 [Roseobacter sp.]